MRQRCLFPAPRPEVTDEDVVAAFRVVTQHGGRLPRVAELYLSTVCAEYLIDELSAEGHAIVRLPLDG